MISAFGIDHGAISKARVPGTGLIIPGKAARAARATMKNPPPTRTRTQAVKDTLNRVGSADVSLKGVGTSTGGGVRGIGRFMEHHPGATGTALVGGGGYGGYRYLKQKEPKRKEKG